ncbi:type VI secretion system membrane subunit TssM [Pseudomonas sp. SZMC_28357]|uniref:type VI secretion system membrane subunit TssM n=1 Tax=Pseudomonas sp. SZMC_28357 TaxID=3074380 RepID=UPI0028713464|nr:type VI secretion system membrane subunit TssM [Pseudomonas sp. SZMC_28357]MDR9751375.1 type VI secretion system membrane subunit TssM [Pseudomonas sp. SZMC_28357]
MGIFNIWNAWSLIRRYSNWLSRPWLLSLVGVVLVSLLVWYEGPLLAFDGRQPLAPEAWRWRLIALLLFIWVLWWAVVLWRVQRANRLLMQGVAGDEATAQKHAGAKASQAEVALLSERMRSAMAVLRKASPGWKLSRQYLYQLPWYLFVGAPGSGKTTALTHSGLQFPLSDSHGAAAVGGVGGTRNCDWWFTDEAVLLDTAGRYTTQDSYTEVDKAAWFGFLDLLKKHRRRRPVNGVIVALSVSDLLQQNEAQRQIQAQAIRARIQELHERLGLNFPVYVVVTKCDLLAGFAEFFEPMGREERSQVWGVTFPLTQGDQVQLPGAALASFPGEFDALEKQLQGRVLERVQQERDLSRRALLYSFPQQFAGIGEVLTRFLNTVFEPNRYQDPALLRGVYFTSGTQEGSPIDRVMSSLAAAFGLGRNVLPAGFGSGRSYFITRLMREVIFKEAGLAGVNPLQERRQRLWLRGAMALIGVTALLLVLGLTVSYQRNEALVQASAVAVADVAKKARELPAQGTVLVTLPLLNAARDLPAGFAQRNDSVPLLNRMGLYQGDKLGTGAIALYRRLLRGTLLPHIVSNLESALRRGDASNQDFLYETLRVYLMLGERQFFDAASVQAWVEVDWRREVPQATEAQRQQLSAHVEALLDSDDESAEPVQLDAALISKVRQTLASMPLAERTYNRLKRQIAALRLPESSVNGAAGRDVSSLLVRRSGTPLSQGVSGVFSVAGYRELVARSGSAVAEMAKDNWVLGREEKTSAADTEAMQQAVLGLYYAEYIRQWDALLGDVQLVPLTGLDQAALVSGALAANDSPLRAFLQLASRETTLEGALKPAADKDANPQVRKSFDDARKKLETALGSNDGSERPLDTSGNPVDPHFAPLHSLVNSPAPGPLDEASAMLKDAAQYFDGAEAARRSGSPAPSGEVLTRVKRAATTLPAPISAVLRDVDSSGGALTLGNERERLNALWNSVGAPFCRAAIDGRYPVVRNASRDITADDFGKFFGPGGVMDDFFSKNLVPYVDMSSNPWRARAAGSGSVSLSQDVINQFQRAARLRDMFFVNGARQPSLRFDLKALSADPALSKVTLDIDGQAVVYEAGVTANFTPIVLPSGKGGDRVQLQTEPPLASDLSSDGPWAWLHVLDRGTVKGGQGERYQVAFTLDGRAVQYELRASSVINPFRRDALEQFRCPSRL